MQITNKKKKSKNLIIQILLDKINYIALFVLKI